MFHCSTEPAWRLTAECPRCGNDLVVRYARRDHQPFIGCVSYPTCRFTCEYDEALQCLANPHEHEAEVRRCKIENQRLAAEVAAYPARIVCWKCKSRASRSFARLFKKRFGASPSRPIPRP